MTTTYQPSKAEREANATKALAEAELAKAQAAKAAAETVAAKADAEAAKLRLAEAREKHAKRLAGDDQHHVYRFAGEVTDTSAKGCMAQLTEWSRLHPDGPMEIVFSSPGGSVTAGMALFDHIIMLRQTGHHITTGTVGWAASMAGILLQAGDHRWMGEQAWVLIHRAQFGAVGPSFEVEDRVEWIKRIEKRIVDIFVARSGGRLTAQKVRKNWERKNWWLCAEECSSLGIVDEVRGTLT